MKFGRAGRVFWPEDGTRFAAIGGFVGLASDFASFLGNLGSPKWLFWPALLGVVLLLVVCWRRVFDSKTTDTPDKLKAAIDCAPCTVFRVLLFACIGIGLLLMAGQGVTATERIGTSLGLIEARVNEIHGDTTVIRETLSGMELVKNPESAQEYFHNAWVLNMQRGDSAGAWQQLQALYHRHTPNKLDAADMYLTVGKSQLARPALQAQMVEIGRSRRDAAMLVVAARNAENPEAARALREEAQVIDPDMPFAHWDLADYSGQGVASIPGDTQKWLEHERAKLVSQEKFIEVAQRGLVARYFFRPQHLPDHEAQARQLIDYTRRNIQSLEKTIESQRFIDNSFKQSTERLNRMRQQNEAQLQRLQQRRQGTSRQAASQTEGRSG